MASTLNGTGITFSDGSTQNSGNTVDAIGTYALFWTSSGTSIAAGSTISGSYLFRATAVPANSFSTYADSPGGEIPIYPFVGGNTVNRTTTLSANGYTLVPNSGTWRAMSFAVYARYDACVGGVLYKGSLFVRVS